MQILNKEGNEVLLIYGPKEEAEIGENIKIWDSKKNRGLLIQIIEINLANIPGILEDLIRNESIPQSKIIRNVPADFQQFITEVRNIKAATGKIRKELSGNNQDILPWTGWMPDREVSVEPVNDEWLISRLQIGEPFPIFVGTTAYGGARLNLSAYDLQEGGITVILGKKGTGKSHATKTILLGLMNHGASCIVFDINNEYSGLSQTLSEENSNARITTMEPGENLRFLLRYIDLDVLAKVLRVALGTGDASVYELSRAWHALARDPNRPPITFATLLEWLEENITNRAIIGAIERRFAGLERTGLITEDSDLATTIEHELEKIANGGALVFNLKGKSRDVSNIVVSTVMSKLESLLESNSNYPPVFLFAEEAHLYVGDTDWDDIITRMRHLGTFQFYITNTPTSLPEVLIRQTDNIFLFNLLNDEDFSHIRPTTRLDNETITLVAKALPPRTCLIIGSATKDYPFVVRTPALKFAAGATRRFFKFDNGIPSTAHVTHDRTSSAERPTATRPEEEFTV